MNLAAYETEEAGDHLPSRGSKLLGGKHLGS